MLTCWKLRPCRRSMYELLKTPGKKKDAPKRTRVATAAVVLAPQRISEPPAPVAHVEESSQAFLAPQMTDATTPLESPAAVNGISDSALTHHASAKELSMIVEDEEPGEQSRLSPVRPTDEPIAEQDEDDAAPAREVPFEPMDWDLAVPLRDVPGPSLKRKPSVTQFSGLPAPSPLRKSMRMSHEPTGPSLVHTPGAGLGKRTSWLSKAKEAKALEMTGPGRRIGSRGDSTAASGTTANGTKDRQKSGETFVFTFPNSRLGRLPGFSELRRCVTTE